MLKGKIAVVTGGSQGIGKAICDKLEANGAITETCSYETCDVSNFQSSENWVKSIIEKHGKIDILVNNAGITRDNLLMRMSEEDFESVLRVNLFGTFNMVKNVIPFMLKAKSGRIVNIASIMGVIGNAGQANYSASKAGIIGFTKSIAKEVGSRGITSNAVAPGFIHTAMTESLDENLKKEYASKIPLKRIGTADDVANAVLFLTSELSSYITGQVIPVDGGLI